MCKEPQIGKNFMNSIFEIALGIICNVCFVTCYWPQIIKSIKTKSVNDVSIFLFLLSIGGYLSAAGYVYLRFGVDFWLMVNYALGCLSSIFMVCIYCKYRESSK